MRHKRPATVNIGIDRRCERPHFREHPFSANRVETPYRDDNPLPYGGGNRGATPQALLGAGSGSPHPSTPNRRWLDLAPPLGDLSIGGHPSSVRLDRP
jgi:hypothetical protein